MWIILQCAVLFATLMRYQSLLRAITTISTDLSEQSLWTWTLYTRWKECSDKCQQKQHGGSCVSSGRGLPAVISLWGKHGGAAAAASQSQGSLWTPGEWHFTKWLSLGAKQGVVSRPRDQKRSRTSGCMCPPAGGRASAGSWGWGTSQVSSVVRIVLVGLWELLEGLQVSGRRIFDKYKVYRKAYDLRLLRHPVPESLLLTYADVSLTLGPHSSHIA